MRVIGGDHRGRRLKPIKAGNIRPTSDRLRETIFNIVGVSVRDAVVLDLYAGSGALSIEALSRGAASAVLVDHSPKAIEIMRGNIDICGLGEKARIIRWNIVKNLDCIQHHRPAFDLVFVDAPYSKGMVAVTLDHLVKSHAVAPKALVIVEHSHREPLPAVKPCFPSADTRKAGKSLVSFLTYMV